MKNHLIRPAQVSDLEKIMPLIEHSRRLMRSTGNYQQWISGYPSREIISNDISNGNYYLICNDGDIIGSFALIEGLEPTYQVIDGQWEEDDRPYGTIHRIACAPGQRGIFDICIEWCRRQVTSLRIDTHADNSPMLHLAYTRGFKHCGVVYMQDGSPREAFQMLDTGCLCVHLKEYVEQSILPLYDNFDPAHQRDHVNTVIRNSIALAAHYTVEINMVYLIAAYHDVGLSQGRERHHTISAAQLLADQNLRRWFNDKQLKLMAEAVEDHRASSSQAPRSIYGKIVAEADRDIEPLKIIRRTVQFGLSNHPNLDREAHWQRALDHLNEKYAEGGYMHLWLPESPNAEKLTQLRRIIADPDRLRTIFNEYFDEK